eukprot:3276573-Amphidinium_carterae.1
MSWFFAGATSLLGVWPFPRVVGCVALMWRDCAVEAAWFIAGAASPVVGLLDSWVVACAALWWGGVCCVASSLLSCSGRDLQESASDCSVSSSMNTGAASGGGWRAVSVNSSSVAWSSLGGRAAVVAASLFVVVSVCVVLSAKLVGSGAWSGWCGTPDRGGACAFRGLPFAFAAGFFCVAGLCVFVLGTFACFAGVVVMGVTVESRSWLMGWRLKAARAASMGEEMYFCACDKSSCSYSWVVGGLPESS